MAATNFYLPNDCWESIFKFVNDGSDDDNNGHRHLKPLSLVSKQFLSITNSLRFSLNIYNPARPYLHYLLTRFTNLTSLNLTCFRGDLDALLSLISFFRLNLTSLNISKQPAIPANGLRDFSLRITTLTSLKCSKIDSINSSDLFLIADCFPLLEELDLSNPGKNFIDRISLLRALETLSLALFKLRKVNLSGHEYINDQYLLHLFKNCKHLEEVIIYDYLGLTSAGIASSLRERPTLRSLSLSNSDEQLDCDSHFIDSLVSLKGLTCIDLTCLQISDELLYSIAREGLPLTRLVLQNCTGYSYAGIFRLLSKCQCIQHLDLESAYFLKDEHVVELSLFLGDLVSINLSQCIMLTNSALFALIRKCPSLNEIKMNETSKMDHTSIRKKKVENSNSLMDCVVNPQLKYLGLALNLWLSDEDIKMDHTSIRKKKVENSNSLMDCVVNPQLKSLGLALNLWLSDEDINMFASIFSNLELLDLSCCYNISEDSIGQVLSRCYKIRHLNLFGCKGVKLHRLNFEFVKLEVLELSYTSIDDEALFVISKSCCELLQLFLQKCDYITKKGVMHVVKYCTQLKEINLRDCDNVSADVVASMVFLRRSLRKITSPSYSNFSDIERKHFSHHGCRVC